MRKTLLLLLIPGLLFAARYDVYVNNLCAARGIDLWLTGDINSLIPDARFSAWTCSVNGGRLAMATASDTVTADGWMRVAVADADAEPGIEKCLVNEAVASARVVRPGVTVKRQPSFDQPAGTYRRVSMQKEKVTVFERGYIGSKKFEAQISTAPVAYKDSTGKMQLIDLTERKAKTPGFGHMVRAGHTAIEYSDSGKMRYEREGASFAFIPNFVADEITLDFSTIQAKEVVTLPKGDCRVSWKIEGDSKLARRLTLPFSAVDADGKRVTVSEKWFDDSVSVTVGTGKGKIYLDPSIAYDTLIVALAADIYGTRDATSGTAAAPSWNGSSTGRDGSNYYRSPMAFALDDLPSPTALDSVYIYLDPASETMAASDSVFMYIVKGTYTGSDIVNDNFNDFVGWAAASAYTLTEYTTSTLFWNNEHNAKNAKFTAAACDSVEALMSVDTLRLFAICKDDKIDTNYGSTSKYITWGATLPYLVIYYQTGYPPGLTTLADTSRAAARLVGEIDSTGGANCTVRGFKLTKGDADTTTISESGSFTAGTYSLYTSWLWPDSVYYFRSYATNPVGTSYGDWKSFTATSGTGGGTLTVDGRQVNTNVR